MYCIVLYCIVLYCIVLYCIVLYCIVLYCIVLYCIVLYCIVLYCIVLYCIVLYCIVLYCIVCMYVCMYVCMSVCPSKGKFLQILILGPVIAVTNQWKWPWHSIDGGHSEVGNDSKHWSNDEVYFHIYIYTHTLSHMFWHSLREPARYFVAKVPYQLLLNYHASTLSSPMVQSKTGIPIQHESLSLKK